MGEQQEGKEVGSWIPSPFLLYLLPPFPSFTITILSSPSSCPLFLGIEEGRMGSRRWVGDPLPVPSLHGIQEESTALAGTCLADAVGAGGGDGLVHHFPAHDAHQRILDTSQETLLHKTE